MYTSETLSKLGSYLLISDMIVGLGEARIIIHFEDIAL